MKRFAFTCLAFLTAIHTFAAYAAKSDEERIKALEQKLSALQQTYMTNNQEVASALASSQAIQQEFASVKGSAEAARHLIESGHTETMKLITELDHRIQAIEDRLAIFSNQLSKALGRVAPEAAAEAELYQKALDLANSANYLEAASVFQTFLSKYARSSFAPNAKYWVGECFYSIRDYKRAIQEYQNYIEKYPRDAKIPDALLKQGNSFYELGMLEEAKAFYDKVAQSYPGSSAATQARAKMERIKDRKANAETDSGGLSSYPTETLEQQRHRTSGAKTAPVEEKSTAKKREGEPVRDF